MKYEFHVGDYVETKDGRVGYVDFCSRGSYDIYLRTIEKNGYSYSSKMLLMPEITDEELAENFVRIGQYDFTKSERFKKIKQLEMGKDNVWNERCGGWLYVHQNKINELIEAVNRLEEKVNEMAQD